MFKISDPKDVVYYIKDLTGSSDGLIDPLLPFSQHQEAVNYALGEMKLEAGMFTIIEWEVE